MTLSSSSISRESHFDNFHTLFLKPLKQFGSPGCERMQVLPNAQGRLQLNIQEKRSIWGRAWCLIKFKFNEDDKHILDAFNYFFDEYRNLIETLPQSSAYEVDLQELQTIHQSLSSAIEQTKNSKKLYSTLSTELSNCQKDLSEIAFTALKRAHKPKKEMQRDCKSKKENLHRLHTQITNLENQIDHTRDLLERTYLEIAQIQDESHRADEEFEEEVEVARTLLEQEAQRKKEKAHEEATYLLNMYEQMIEIQGPHRVPKIDDQPSPYAQLLTGDKLDVVIRCKNGDDYYTNHEILSQASPWFKAMFQENSSSKKFIIDFSSQYSLQVIKAACLYCQHDLPSQIQIGDLPELLKFAQEYQIEDLKDACYRQIESEIDSAQKAILWIDQTQDLAIIKLCQEILKNHLHDPMVIQFLLEQPFNKEDLYHFLFASSPLVTSMPSHLEAADFLIKWSLSKRKTRAELPIPSTNKGKEKVRVNDDADLETTDFFTQTYSHSLNDLFSPISQNISFCLWDLIRLDKSELAFLMKNNPIPSHQLNHFTAFSPDRQQFGFDSCFAKESKIVEVENTYTEVNILIHLKLLEDIENAPKFISPPFYIMGGEQKNRNCYQVFLKWDPDSNNYVSGIFRFGTTLPQVFRNVKDRSLPTDPQCQMSLTFANPTDQLKNKKGTNQLQSKLKFRTEWSLNNIQESSKTNIFAFNLRFNI